MKKITLLVAICFTLTFNCLFAVQDGSGKNPEAQNVRVSFTTDLVENFPIDITAVTAGDYLGITLGPKQDGHYCTIDARIIHNDDGSIAITTSFSEERGVPQHDGTVGVQRVGFKNQTIVLGPGDEEVLFSSGDKRFVIGFSTLDK